MADVVIPQGAQVVRERPSEDFNKLIQELTQLKKDFDLYLCGQEEVKDENGNITLEQREPPKVNAKGRKAVLSWVQTYVNPNTFLSENKDFNVQANYRIDMRNIADELFKNLNEYELTIENASAIHSRMCQLIFHALQRSTSDKHYIFSNTTTNYGQPQQQEPKKGMFGGLF